MRIVAIGPAYPFRGATGHYGSMMVNALRKRHDVLFLSVTRQYPDFLYPGKTQVDASRSHIECENEPALSYANPLTWPRVVRRACDYRPDMVILQWPYTVVAPQLRYISARIKRHLPEVKIIFLCHNIVQHEHRPFDEMLTRLAFRRGDYFIVHDRDSRDSLLRLKPEARVTVTDLPVFDAFASNPISREDARRALKLEPETPVVLFFGHVRPYKGLSTLIKAFPRVLQAIPSAHLLIVGEFWQPRRSFEKEIEDLGFSANATVVDEYVPNEAIPTYFLASDLVALPYLSASGSGIQQIAFAFSKPVVASAVGCLPDTVEEGKTGYLVPPGDPEALADAIVRFFGSGEADAFARNIELVGERFSWDRFVDVVEAISENIESPIIR